MRAAGYVSKVRLAIVALLGVAAIAVFTGCTPEAAAEARLIAGVNETRAQHGLPPLAADPQLTHIARLRSGDMAAKGYFSHNPPDGCNYICLMQRNGVGFAWAGENIAWNTWDWAQTADVALNMWRNSPPHMQNILGCHYTRVGAGAVRAADGKVYHTMIFEGNRGC